MKSSCGCHSHSGFLTKAGYAAVAQRELELNALDAMGIVPYLDKVGSVSGLELERDPHDLYEFVTEDMTDDQYRRFHNGS